MKTWFAENVLVEQPFVKDDSKTVGELLKRGRPEAGQVRPLQGRRSDRVTAVRMDLSPGVPGGPAFY